MNSYEAQIIALQIRAKAIEAELISMQANDRVSGCTYTEEAYLRCSHELRSISDEIQMLANHL